MADITVTKPTPKTFQVKVDSIDAGSNLAVPLRWDIKPASSSWHFPADGSGIVIKGGGAAFDPIVGGSKYMTSARKAGYAYPNNSTQKAYNYTITVTDDDTTLVIDPTIINQP